jgi:hypothetical protein
MKEAIVSRPVVYSRCRGDERLKVDDANLLLFFNFIRKNKL